MKFKRALKSPNQIKLVNNVNPINSNKINEDFDFDRKLLYKGNNYTKEVKPNCIRLYHQTNKDNINSIIDNGLLTNKAKHYDNPGNCIWLSKKLPDNYSWNYGNSLIELDIPNELIDGYNFRQVSDNNYNCWFDIKPEYINAIYLQTPYRTSIMKDFQNTRDINKSLERFKNGELTERASDYKMLTKTNVNQPYERYWFAKTFKNEKSKEPEIHKIALQLQTDDISIVEEVLKEIIPYDYDRIRIFGSTNNLNNLKNDGYELLNLNESLLNESKSWDVIWTDDCESFKNKLQAIKRAKEIYEKDLDKEVFIVHADDKDSDGYYANGKIIYIKDLYESLNEVYPNKGESKKDFTKRFMSVTKNEYPNIKQRYAIAMSYWDRRNKKRKNESLNEDTITLYTVQDKKVLNKLNKGETYTASYNNIFDMDYLDLYKKLSSLYGFKNCPIFCADEDSLHIIESSGIEANGNKELITLNVPRSEVKVHNYYDWTDYLFFHFDDDGTFETEEEIDEYLLKLEDRMKNQICGDDEDKEYVIDRIEPSWVVKLDSESLNEKLLRGAGLDVFYTDSPYQAKQYLKSKDRTQRIYINKEQDIYLIADAYDCVHHHMIRLAKAEGYISPDFSVNDMFSRGICLIYVPRTDYEWDEERDCSEDCYSDKWAYEDGSAIYYRDENIGQDFEKYDLYKILGKGTYQRI